MMGRTHMTFGLTLGVVYYTWNQDADAVAFQISSDQLKMMGTVFFGLFLGSILPDIDHPKSFIGKKFKPLSRLLSKAIGHRTYTHSLLALVLLVALTAVSHFYFAQQTFFIFGRAVVCGWAGHIFLDMLTKEGVPLWYPFSKKRLSLLPIRTNSLWEHVFFLLLVGLNAYLLL